MIKVLIAESDPMVAMINEQYISKNKEFHVVAKCTDGMAAKQYLLENDVQLLLLEVHLSGMDGFALVRQIRQEKLPVDVIMITAADDVASLEEALRLGAVDYLVKPFTFERFQTALNQYALRTDTLRELENLNQNQIDLLWNISRRKGERLHPKGIQEKTLHLIMLQLQENAPDWMSGEMIAEKTGLTSVTVRRYMAYLTETGAVCGKINYETGGRPCTQYRIS